MVCTIVSLGPIQRLARLSDETRVRCPACGTGWLTSNRHAARIAAGEHTGHCESCRRPRVEPMEKHRRYWLRLFGVELRGRTAAQYVQEEGLPPALHDLASTFYAESQRMFIGVGA